MIGHEKPHCKDCVYYAYCINPQKKKDIICHTYKNKVKMVINMKNSEIISALIKTINRMMKARIRLLERIPDKDLTDKEKEDLLIAQIGEIF